ncbi:fasciclin-like arabinogalactan protein 21 [Dorcoceras hygrometricum]|uniref:Fasciclin-like arabinogalactan protein 21 n=1 Tax=Dorcoceras hygrometricum TaxID=472368 RepID=A0A2Z7CIX1_9LAMI|nr:fasciclin-like arabinogalactan protein 21 [Dorcoceras hygrometricum]
MAETSWSHWWHAPFYLAMSFALVYISITTPYHSGPDDRSPSAHILALDASRALRAHGGFNTIATLLQISPDLCVSRPESTLFAIHDSAISNLSIPPWAMQQLLRYHSTPSTLPKAELFKKPPGFCFQTLLQDKNLAVTKNDAKTGSIMINNVLVSHHDLFLQGPFAVHGVLGPFDPNSAAVCNVSTDHTNLVVSGPTDNVEWDIVVRVLGSHGFVSFAIGLNSILEEILEDYTNLSSVTIFAPPNSGFISTSSPLLDRIVKLHILPRRFTHLQLLAARNSSLKTLVPGYDIKINTYSDFLDINGAEITRPDFFSSKKFVIHGISKCFDSEEFSSSFR